MGHIAVIALISAAVLTGCGNRRESRDAELLNGRKSPKPLIVGMSGFATCKQNEDFHNGEWGPLGHAMFTHVRALADTVTSKFGIEPAILASCFTSGSQIMASSSLDNWAVTEPMDEDYIDSVHATMNEYTDVFVVGHSYGGWLALKTVETFEGNPSIIKSLYSIDAISKRLCFFNNPAECVSAPRDILARGRKKINENTKVWVNPWQRRTFFLHSSAIPQADENPLFELDHWSMDTEAAIWADMDKRVAL